MMQLMSMLARKLSVFFILSVLIVSTVASAQSTGEVVVPVVLDSEEGGPSSQDVGVGAATGVGVAFGAGAGGAGGADGASSESGAGSEEQAGAGGTPADASGSTDADAGAGSGLPDPDELEPIPGTQQDVQLGEGEQPRSPDWETFFGTLQPADDFIALMSPATGEVFARKQLCTLTCQGDISAYLEPARQALDYVAARVADANNAKARAMEKVGRVENGRYAPSDEFIAALADEILADETLDAEKIIERISDEMLRQKADAMANAILETEFTRAEQAYDDALQGLAFAELYIRDLVRACILDKDDPAVQLLLDDITNSYALVIGMHKNTGQILSLPIAWDAGALEAARLQQRYDELKVETATQLATEVAFAVIQPEVIALKASILLGKSAWTLAAAALETKRIRAAVHLAEGADAAGDVGRAVNAADGTGDLGRAAAAADNTGDLPRTAAAGKKAKGPKPGKGGSSGDAGGAGSGAGSGSGSGRGGGTSGNVAGAADDVPQGRPGRVEGSKLICGNEPTSRVRMTSTELQAALTKIGGDIVPSTAPPNAGVVLRTMPDIRKQWDEFVDALRQKVVDDPTTRPLAEQRVKNKLQQLEGLAQILLRNQ